MSLILQIETATQVCSAALSKDGHTIAIKELQENNIHARSLTLFVQDVMKQAKVSFADLDAIAVSKGPGSYTGLRIGVSTVKGFCFALDKPLIAIDTLKMMAQGYLLQHPDYKGLICPMIDARRMEVFTAIYNPDLEYVDEISAKIIDENSFTTFLENQEVVFIGDGAEKCRSSITSQHASFSAGNYNSAGNMSKLSHIAFENKVFENLAYFEPFYLKDFVLTTPKKRV
ncbi:tRNA (adenosine(37)-N6)-threonylcarbamoyltransferase complex dimerization subunit type 1 TsaB [Pedobacter sp. PWIIR3]